MTTLYASAEELLALLGETSGRYVLEVDAALAAACRTIDRVCDRRFYPDEEATARLYRSNGTGSVWVDDFYTTSGLAVATVAGADGSFGDAWSASDYQLEPLNGMVGGEPGWPYDRITTVSGRAWPSHAARAAVQVIAKWGWAAPPEPIAMASKLLAKDLFKAKDQVGGVQGFDQFGAVRVRLDPTISMLIGPYRRPGVA